MNLRRIQNRIISNLKNIPGWSVNRKIVVFISDDWGDLRVHSNENLHKLINQGIPLDRSPHTEFEDLATHDDLHRLFEVLSSVKDKNGRHAILTPFTIMANPDFERIRESDFREYFYTPFFDILKQREGGDKTIKAWFTGIDNNLFVPELHGREHVNVPIWMEKLQSGDETYRFCFNQNYAHHTSPDMNAPIVAAYYFRNEQDFEVINNSLDDGIKLFKSTFGRSPSVFNPPNGIFHSDYYRVLTDGGVTSIDASHRRQEPDKNGGLTMKRHSFGEISAEGLVHFISNCAFEPVKRKRSVVDDTLKQVEAAFRWKKPALINTHRINYVKGRGGDQRDLGLSGLSELLNRLTAKWPDIEFMGTGEFGRFMNTDLAKKKSA